MLPAAKPTLAAPPTTPDAPRRVVSVFELFTIGIGPSSSHTVGPMRAAAAFVERLDAQGVLERVRTIRTRLCGSLGATGHGHGTDRAVIAGLQGETPEGVEPERMHAALATTQLLLRGRHEVPFELATDIVFDTSTRDLPHPNTLLFTAFDGEARPVASGCYASIGGGFVVDLDAATEDGPEPIAMPYPFDSGAELIATAHAAGRSVGALMLANEAALRPQAEVHGGVLEIWDAMRACVRAGLAQTGELPGGLRVRRRAARLKQLIEQKDDANDPLAAMGWVNLWALAVNEENAAGGRVVTAPTNGAAGIVPAVLHYYERFVQGADDEGVVRFLLAATAIGHLCKRNASISGADVGCQGEVGSACAMAAAGLAEVLGGTPEQVEHAAEIAIEHNLGLTCDPVRGLVQIPCIERNAIASVKAINAARMAVQGDGSHRVSLDQVIRTMRDTGRDMRAEYKETSRGGLAVNVVEC